MRYLWPFKSSGVKNKICVCFVLLGTTVSESGCNFGLTCVTNLSHYCSGLAGAGGVDPSWREQWEDVKDWKNVDSGDANLSKCSFHSKEEMWNRKQKEKSGDANLFWYSFLSKKVMMSSSRSKYKAKCYAITLNVDVFEQVSTAKFELYFHWKERGGRVQPQARSLVIRILSCNTGAKNLIIMDRLISRLFMYISYYECMTWSAGFLSSLKRVEGTEGGRGSFPLFKFESKRAR